MLVSKGSHFLSVKFCQKSHLTHLFQLGVSIHLNDFRLVWNPSTWEPHFGWKLSYSLSLIWGFLFSWRTFVFFLTPFHLSHSFRLGGFFHITWTTFVLYETLPLKPPLLYEKSGLTFTPDGFICLRFRKQFGVKVKMSWRGFSSNIFIM